MSDHRKDGRDTSLKLERKRDGQQWLLDYLVKVTGREQNFAYDERRFPPEAKSYRMIPRIMYKLASHQETIAQAAEAAGHAETARELYFKAVETYRHAQHTIFKDDNSEKQFLYERMSACYDRIIELSPYPIERVEVPWEGVTLAGLLHLVPGLDKAPTVIFLPGMDMTKEAFPDPENNPFLKRGMHVLSFDGPGQGISNLRKIRVTDDNYERAASAALDYLANRPEVDAERLAVSGFSMGSYWGMRLAAIDPRVKAVATAAACYGSKQAIFEEASPRFKQMFMYMAGIHHEPTFDEMAEKMHLYDHASRISCPTLQVVGEYDPLCHLEDAYAVYELLEGPKEFWVLENDFHAPWNVRNLGSLSAFPFLADWIRDALAGRIPPDHNRQVLVPDRGGKGPYEAPVESFWLPLREVKPVAEPPRVRGWNTS
jgi:dipeptidyl aminopeptidase/acylaminoacyl peptidase